MIGIFTALKISKTARIARGRIAGPDNPPTRFARIGSAISMSIAIPGPTVLIAVIASAPAASAARAISTMFSTFGESFIERGIFPMAFFTILVAFVAS